ncbi:MAG: hypothetical protein HYX27_09850 [Acidobacteria bacterium]|nr:hypothetical protein [Acidobacteriota bacterium]
MFSVQERSIGTKYTQTVTLLLLAFVFVPALVLITGPGGYGSMTTAMAGSALLIAWAGHTWRNQSNLTISSIAAAPRRR